jgi:hypothetical protein
MADLKAHLTQVAHNKAVLRRLDSARFPDWSITVCFYIAVHYVEAYFYQCHTTQHTFNHQKRRSELSKTLFQDFNFRRSYRDLEDLSRKARYLMHGGVTAADVPHAQRCLKVISSMILPYLKRTP